MEKWISIEDNLPIIKFTSDFFWVFDGEDVCLSEWHLIDCDYKKVYSSTGGYWFGYLDGTECWDAYENITHWMPIKHPLPPGE